MNSQFNYADLNRFSRMFINSTSMRSKNDRNSYILRKVLKFEISKCSQNFTIEDFINYFYFDKTFNESFRELKKALNESSYVYLHSYGKNGKSTFIKIFLKNELPPSRFGRFFFDFKAKKKSTPKLILKEKVKAFYKDYFLIYENTPYKANPFYLFFKYISDNYNLSDILQLDDQESRISINNLYKVAQKFTNDIENYKYRYKKNGSSSFYIKKDLFINELYKAFQNNVDKLLPLLIAVRIYYSVKHDKHKQVAIVFDNLDDVYTYIPEQINNTYTANIIEFMQNLTNCFSNIFVNESLNSHVDPKFIFIYRTSNYLSTISSMYELDDSIRSRIDYFEEDVIRRVRITSVKDSFDILKKRVEFYEKLCNGWGIKKSNKYHILINTMEAFADIDRHHKVNYAPATILRLWNGNKLSFIDFILRVSIREIEKEIFLDPLVSSRVKTELFFHLFIKYFHSKSANNSPIAKFIKYTFSSFNNELEDERCSLSRLFFTYIYNKRRKNLEIRSIKDAFTKGIPLNEFINDIRQIKIGGEHCYSFEDIKIMFENIFSFEIDNWGNFFSCCTPADMDNSNFPKEHYKWTKNTLDSIKDPERGKKIKFFDNDSAGYFMFQLRRSFEYFSYCSNKNTLPLSSAISYTKLSDGNIQVTFDEILNRVYKRIERICYITYTFFKNAFHYHSVDTYCNSYWSAHNKMYFDDLLSRILGYVEDVRHSLLNGKIQIRGDYSKYSAEEKKEAKSYINIIFLSNILKYLTLFEELYNQCRIRDGIKKNQPISHELEKTKNSFDFMKTIALGIQKNPFDFETKIQTPKSEAERIEKQKFKK